MSTAPDRDPLTPGAVPGAGDRQDGGNASTVANRDSRSDQADDRIDGQVSSAVLSDWLGISQRRVQQLVSDGTLPAPVDGLYGLRECVQARVKYLEALAAGKEVNDTDQLKKKMQIELLQHQQNKLKTDQERIQMDLDERRGALIPASAAQDVLVRMARVLAEGADSLPDRIEHATGAPSEVIERISRETDRWRMDLYRVATESFGAVPERDAARDDEPDAKPKTGKKRGRPPKDKTDVFTPGLFA